MVTYNHSDVVLVLFPFTERRGAKQRPAIVLSDAQFGTAHDHSILVMVTTASFTKWPSDLPIKDVKSAGLLSPSVARAKFFTISHDLVIGKVGTLAPADRNAISAWSGALLSPA